MTVDELKKPPLDELMHYGVIGMKWGRRRSQDELDRINGRAYDFQKTENGYVLKKGSTVHRVTADPDNEKEGYAYISFNNEDVKGYRKEITQWLSIDNPHIKTFDMSMKVTKDLVLPDEMVKVKTFIDLYNGEKLDKVDLIKMYHNNSYNDELIGKPKKLADRLEKQGLSKNLAEPYALFSMAIYNNPQLQKTFIESLKSKGYDAMDDLEDMYSHRVRPLIVFNREDSLKITNKLPIPSPYEDGWDKIVKEADESKKATSEIQKNRGF